VKGVKNSLYKGQPPSPRGDNGKSKNNTENFQKSLLLQNQQTNFNETWYKSFLGKGNSKLFK
jgi:hypothetical protein